jgi:hypothetical protein
MTSACTFPDASCFLTLLLELPDVRIMTHIHAAYKSANAKSRNDYRWYVLLEESCIFHLDELSFIKRDGYGSTRQ